MGPPKRKAPALKVPTQSEDPAERKRVLNVLAQRRYRQRRREHVEKLEAAAASPPSDDQNPNTEHLSELSSLPAIEEDSHSALDPSTITPSTFQNFDEAYPPEVFQQSATTTTYAGALNDPFDTSFVAYPDDLQLATFDNAWGLPSLPASPVSTHTSSLTSFSSPGSSAASACTFPDERHLPMLELDLLRGATSIASRLGVLPLIWSLESTSPIALPSNAFADYTHLPQNLQPTALQRRTPHHPLIDLLPWPTVRNKILLVLSMPEELRPAVAAKPTALVDFVYDIEDSAEGVRIWGDDPYSDQAWEVGEKVFKNWWWAFDSNVVDRSNRLRRERGARLLGRGEGAVLGEVT